MAAQAKRFAYNNNGELDGGLILSATSFLRKFSTDMD